MRVLWGSLAAAALLSGTASAAPPRAPVEWPSYNRTLSSERFAPLDQINRGNVGRLKVLCTYDLGAVEYFPSALVEVDGALFASTAQDTISIDPNTCKQNWRVHEAFQVEGRPHSRGVAVAGGRVYRGFADGAVRAYDAKTGARLWSTAIADPAAGEAISASPVAWNGMVFIGQSGGDARGVKGRVYALDAATGRILWEQFMVPRQPGDKTRGPLAPEPPALLAASWTNDPSFPITGGGTWTSYTVDTERGLLLVPGGNPAPDFLPGVRGGDNLFTGSVVAFDARTGAYRSHVQLVRNDSHDWDVASPPTLITTKTGRRMMAVTPKDGVLYGVDVATNKILYATPVTTRTNVDAPLLESGTRFCPGAKGGGQWNGPAYDPPTGLLFSGQVDSCVTVKVDPLETTRAGAAGKAWSGAPDFGTPDAGATESGWFNAVDVATGQIRWRRKTATPVIAGVTPTAGGLVLFGEAGGTLYALDTATGMTLWSRDMGAGLGGGLITYDTGPGQRIAVAAGPISRLFPSPQATPRIVVLGL